MSIRTGIWHWQVLVLSLLLGSLTVNVNSLECDVVRCKTGVCNSTGACICNVPRPSSILDGDRPFLGGKFCDERMTMCDGTNSFWCEHGGSCEEIVQGEKYSCKCGPGFAGERCEHSGVPCGGIFCFHDGECLAQTEAESDVCHCPPDWKGSADCSLPTSTPTDSYSNSNTTKLPQAGSSSDTNKTLAVLAVSSVGAVAAAGAVYGKKLFRKKNSDAFKFQQLSQMQTQGSLDDDEDDDN